MSSPVAWTLPSPPLRERLATIAELAQRSLLSHEQDGHLLRLRYARSAAEALERLVAQERACCALLKFELARQPDAVQLAITAPAAAEDVTSVLVSHLLEQAYMPMEACGTSCGCGSVA